MTPAPTVASPPVSRMFACKLGLATFAVVAAVLFAWVSLRFGLNSPPSTSGDEPSYDSIAWELSHGDGFAIDYSDAEFRKPYDTAAQIQPELFDLPSTQQGPVAFRPPLMPVITAAGNLVFGRQFYVLRSLNILLMAATAGFVAWYVSREVGLLAAAVAVLLLCVDVRTRLYARALLTEPLACLLATLLTVLLIRVCKQFRYREVALAGLVTGLSIATRSIVVLWLPGLMIILFLIHRRVHRAGLSNTARSGVVFLSCVLLTTLPWAVRNVLLLDRFAPLGTQGLMELSAGYSDVAWQHHGVWQNLSSSDFFADADLEGATGVARELAIADASKAKAGEWIRANTAKLPALAAMKVYSEFRPHNLVEALVLLLAAIGAVSSWRSTATRILVGLLLTNATAVALTWSVEGRFVVPQLFVLYALCGIGIGRITDWFRQPALRSS